MICIILYYQDYKCYFVRLIGVIFYRYYISRLLLIRFTNDKISIERIILMTNFPLSRTFYLLDIIISIII
jgi:hypothetical protein